ncbi:YihY family inner membrane protein [Massilia sp. PAMC28688]|uniref:YihY family inner membrane protein n=1 Tax=Massilia sp. PAMC28688 TaxID=2861283 RepID=UPI001C62DF0C|nr:YihY family inner membrane protein [Massilia sp. PAMC28688]QYF93237.1 YihY family inner membrane protein [Massilia sp. PAMC28688]
MLSTFSRSTNQKFQAGADVVRGLTWREVRDLILFARRRLTEERLQQVAGSLTFTTTLALVPLLTIVLAIFTTFPVFNNFRAALESYFIQSMMPKGIADTVTSNLTQFADKAKGLSAVGAVALLLTSAAMMSMIERVFNQIWKVKRKRPLGQRVTIYWALMTLGPLLFGLSITATTQLFLATGSLASIPPMVSTVFYTAVSVLLTAGAYTALFMLVPNKTVDWRDAIWGGLAAAIAFEVAKRVFAMFVRQFPTYSVIYGALAALPLLLVWIYLSWMITLVGAVLTAALPVVKYERWWYKPVPGGAFVDAMAILKVLHGSAQVNGSHMVSSATIRAHTRFGYDEMTSLLERMLAVGWVGRVTADVTPPSPWRKRTVEGTDNWVLLANLNQLRLADVYRLFVFRGAALDSARAPDADNKSPMELDTGALARQVEMAVEEGLEQSVAAHFAKGTLGPPEAEPA